MFEHLRDENKPKPAYVWTVHRVGLFRWQWSVMEREVFPLTPNGPSYGDRTIIFGTRRTRRRAEEVAEAMCNGFTAMPPTRYYVEEADNA